MSKVRCVDQIRRKEKILDCRYYKRGKCTRFKKRCICRLECGDTYCSYKKVKKCRNTKWYLKYIKPYLVYLIVLGGVFWAFLFAIYAVVNLQ